MRIGATTAKIIGTQAGTPPSDAAAADNVTPNNSWQAVGQNAALNNGGYFSHDGKLYQQKDGKTFLVTGDAMGDVELDGQQAAQLEQARATPGQINSNPTGISSTNDRLVAEDGVLKHYDANNNLLATYPYTSGVDGATDPSIKDKGPIPPGEYTLNPNNISEAHGLRYIGRRITGDWGNYRVPLIPDPNTNTFGRNGFLYSRR